MKFFKVLLIVFLFGVVFSSCTKEPEFSDEVEIKNLNSSLTESLEILNSHPFFSNDYSFNNHICEQCDSITPGIVNLMNNFVSKDSVLLNEYLAVFGKPVWAALAENEEMSSTLLPFIDETETVKSILVKNINELGDEEIFFIRHQDVLSSLQAPENFNEDGLIFLESLQSLNEKLNNYLFCGDLDIIDNNNLYIGGRTAKAFITFHAPVGQTKCANPGGTGRYSTSDNWVQMEINKWPCSSDLFDFGHDTNPNWVFGDDTGTGGSSSTGNTSTNNNDLGLSADELDLHLQRLRYFISDNGWKDIISVDELFDLVPRECIGVAGILNHDCVMEVINYALGIAGQDWYYNEEFWSDPNLTFPQQNLPSWEAFNNGFPRDEKGNFIYGADKVYDLVGGALLELRKKDVEETLAKGFPKREAGTNNLCALKVSMALNSAGIDIPCNSETFADKNGKCHFINAAALKNWMKETFPEPAYECWDGAPTVSSEIHAAINGQTGIVISTNTGTGGSISGHADIYNGSSCSINPSGTNCNFAGEVCFWNLN